MDGSGDAFVTGWTYASNFPTTTGAFLMSNPGNEDAFVTELNAAGNALVYSTYLGGNSDTEGYGIAVDGSGDAFVTGYTDASNLATPGAYQASYSGNGSAFVTELNAGGNALVYSTYLGGNNSTAGQGIAVDGSGDAFITGYTDASNLATPGAYQASYSGNQSAFVTELNPSGSGVVYSTYLGGNNSTAGQGIAVDGSGDAFVTGYTNASNFPTTPGAFQTSNPGNESAFVTELNPSGSGAVYSTYLGGNNYTVGNGIAVDGSGDAFVTGYTDASNFPTTPGAYQTTFAGGEYYYFDSYDAAFVTELNAAGSALVYSTYLGGNSDTEGYGIAVDPGGDVFVTGETYANNFPTVNALQGYGGRWDAFVSELAPAASGAASLISSTYLGGSNSDYGFGIAVDASGDAFVTGQTYSSNFPTVNAYQTASDVDYGDGAGFVARLTADNLFDFAASNYSVNEDSGSVTVTIVRQGDTADAASVDVTLTDGTAKNGVDYQTPASTTVSFAPGQISQTFTVPLIDDGQGSYNLTFSLGLTDPSGTFAVGPDGTTQVTILETDYGQFQFSAPTYTVSDNVPQAYIVVTRTGGSDQNVTVNYAASDGTATAGVDYVPVTGTLDFVPNQTVEAFAVPVFNDGNASEGDETVDLSLSDPEGGATLGTQTTATLTITKSAAGEFFAFRRRPTRSMSPARRTQRSPSRAPAARPARSMSATPRRTARRRPGWTTPRSRVC